MIDVSAVRSQFPALNRRVHGEPVAYFDGPAGSQIPLSVAEAVSSYLLNSNANRGGPTATSVETDAMIDRAARACADFVGTTDPGEIVFGPNMTSLTYVVSRALATTWSAGDEIIVSRLDHDANVSPWVQAARERDVTVRHIEVRPDDCTLDLESFESQLSDRTRLLAVGYASNAVGTINPVRHLCQRARDAGAVSYVDAVHYAPHGLIDVAGIGCDLLVCSAYKFFGPHVGILWGRRDLLESLPVAKLRPSPDSVPDRWMTGTQNHEGIAGVSAAIDYLAALSQDAAEQATDRRGRLRSAFGRITAHEQQLADRLQTGLQSLPSVRVWGITGSDRNAERVPTFSITHQSLRPQQMAADLAERGLFAWAGNHYALPWTEAAGLEPDGTLRIGLLHYNTQQEVQRLLDALADLTRKPT